MSKNIKIGGEVINGVSALRVESADEEGVLIQFPDEGGTIVYVNGQAVATFDADTKIDKQTGSTTYPQAYIKNPDGTQGVWNASSDVVNSGLVRRGATGQISVPENPAATSDATSKKYVVDNFLAKQTGVTSNAQAYVKWADGSQTMITATSGIVAGSIVMRDANGRASFSDPSNASNAMTLYYADNHYLAKQTGVTTYAQAYYKENDGTNGMINISSGALNGALVRRNGTQINVPETPTEAYHAASKAYVDQNTTGLRYIHTVSIFLVMTNNEAYTVSTRFIDSSSTPVTDPQVLYGKALLSAIAEEGHDPDGTLYFGAMLVRGRYAQQSDGLGLMILKDGGTTVYISRLVSGYNNVSTCSITDTVTAF